ncbi:hypothetical protein SEA_AFLAC_65 [Gordonia phage Aflac]|uniref:Putative phage ssDNA-binding domain-containing protein n=1 Tax=Gordonia phage Duffington TaxID=2507858 RepID=A0A410TCN1_9CAUD|nr:single strand annealing protein [Gordonia phage Duffington]QAU06770.1 hypothetical protein SEA_DUFFINGTON_64 [Gordonia phage Duffington]QKY79455.1 hypothetical protein SEA_JODELIE19_64 [Gordonia phage Jodelie19]QWY82397.1 hypothetical protein SEA_AFLAC_65 [Gordonia phage Aflac]WNT45142.1 SSB protein [Gordonia phage OlgasClover]
MARNDGQLTIENAQIIFRNFAGKEGMYNAEGDRNFCLLLTPELAETLEKDGWNIKTLKAREEDDEPQPYIQISVKYRGRNGNTVRPPTIVMITSKGRTSLSEDECEILDWVDIKNVDLIVRPFEWAVNGKTGIKAYLKSIYVTIMEDELALKYADVPEIGGGANQLEPGETPPFEPGNVIDGEVVSEQHALEA